MSEPRSIWVNGEPRELPPDASVRTLLEELGLFGRPLAVEVNGEVAPRGEHARRALSPGDRVEIVTLVGGG